MSYFLMVCMVCVLCAARTPCSGHTDFSTLSLTSAHDPVNDQNSPVSDEQLQPSWILMGFNKIAQLRNVQNMNLNSVDELDHDVNRLGMLLETDNGNGKVFRRLQVDNMAERLGGINEPHEMEQNVESITSKHREIIERLDHMDHTKEESKLGSQNLEENNLSNVRTKRDIGIDEQYFMRKVFEVYGDGTSMTMEGFEKLLRKLGLLRLVTEFNEQEEHSIGSNQAGSQIENVKELTSSSSVRNTNDANVKQRCLNSKELLSTVSQDVSYLSATNNSRILPGWLFERVCPALVYQLAGESSSERNGCVRVPDNYRPPMTYNNDADDISRNMFQVWVYSTISILIISLCGLLGVAVIPVMGKSYYHQLLQYLVALAVGTLCGDALIHLLPHAMMPSTHKHGHEDSALELAIYHEEEHNTNMWKGLVAMIGLVIFFFTEKALTMIAEWRKHHQRRSKLPSRVRVMREPDGQSNNSVGEKLCKHKYSSYPYCYGEITTETQDNHHNRQHNHHQRPPAIEEEKPLTSNCNSVCKIMENNLEKKADEDWKVEEPIVNNTKKNADGADVPLSETESYTVIIREHETKHHGHTHSHGHVHAAPNSMSSVAWMVVMGDGLHNFTDGMAIGAAFSANIAGGFSTAIAVFCHELPHELGDFAVLLKAGMSAKQAVFYNLLSSVLCLFGMILGVLLGSTPAATSWVFAAAAGMFIYIALVDMIPELSSSHSAEGGSQWQCVLQALGLASGLGIMLIIALYEHDLQNIFSE